MSGGSLPYHLRHGKAIDRNLFVDLLARVGRAFNVSAYTYVGFGGPFLEDCKLLHGALRLSRMRSLETDAEVFKRQHFNRPVSSIELLRMSSGDYLDRYEIDGPTIAWFDYTAPGKLGEQLAEVHRLISKMDHGDVWRVSLNAAAEPLGFRDQHDMHEKRLKELERRLGEYGPDRLSTDAVHNARLPATLLRAIEQVAKKGVEATRGLATLPLSAFKYSDGQQMLSVTGIVIRADARAAFLKATRLPRWPFYAGGWTNEPRDINVPVLSTKERLFVESLLPRTKTGRAIRRRMGYSVERTTRDSDDKLDNFIRYYRLYPSYSRVVL